MFNNLLYVVVQEEERLQYYFDKKTAMKALIRYIIRHKSDVKILVFAPDKDKEAPLKVHKQIKMKKASDGHYKFWLKFALLNYNKDDVMEQPEMFFDTFEEIDTSE